LQGLGHFNTSDAVAARLKLEHVRANGQFGFAPIAADAERSWFLRLITGSGSPLGAIIRRYNSEQQQGYLMIAAR
jgi:hypothetical protein